MEIYQGFILNNENGCSNFFKKGIPEQDLINWAIQYIKGGCFIDIGSHVGTWSILLADHCSHVYAFEASKRTYHQLCGSIALHKLSNKITAFNYGLGSYDDTHCKMILNHVSLDGGGNSFCEVDVDIIEEEIVEMRCLDDFLSKIEVPIDLIKIDVEGYELEVLRGALSTLTACHYPKIIFEAWNTNEYKDKKKKLFEYLEALGYYICPIMGYDYMFLAVHS